MSEPKKYTVFLLGKEYVLVSDEPQEHVNEATSIVNGLMEEIAKNTHFSQEKMSVLVSLQLASQLISERSKISLCNEKTKSLVTLIDQALYDEASVTSG